jgi:simple sugar transport system permease protein
MLGGAFWSSLAGLLKAYRGTNEVVSTLLLNYVAIQLISLVVSGPLKEENAPYPYSSMIQESAMIPKLFRDGNAHFALLLCPVVAIISWFLFSRTTFGVSLRIVGENQRVARYSGIDVKRTHLIAMTAAGALAGLAGSIEVLAMKHRLFHLFVGYYGYEGLVVAFISMGFPLAVIFSAYFIALLKVSGNLLQRELEIPSSIVLVFEGCAVLLVASVIALSVRSNAMTAGDRDNTS